MGFLYDTTNTCNASANVRQNDNAFLGNAYVDLGTYYGFTPYVGGGLGLNMDNATGSVNYNETANGLPYAANLTAVAPFRRCGSMRWGRLGAAAQHCLCAAKLEPIDQLDDLLDWPGRSRPELATSSPPA